MTQPNFKPVAEQLAYLKKGVAEIIPEAELIAKLENSLKTGKPLRVYLGVDPTAPDLHLGHTVVLRKLKHFQDLGHTAVFLIGDFSAMIGDPTGVSETRPPLTREQVDANARTYLEQVYKILDRGKTEVRYNSEWLSKLSSYDIIRLCAKYSLARMLEREDFRERLASGWKGQLLQSAEEPLPSRLEKLVDWVRRDWARRYLFPTSKGRLRAHGEDRPAFELPQKGKASPVNRPSSISIHELLYPLLTALDAVELKSDVELGATEQKFNLLVHRDIQREYGLAGQVALTMPILVGLDGQRKMSKSLGNYVGITEPPNEMFGKIMSIPDSLVWSYFELVTDRTADVIENLRKNAQAGTTHPKQVKVSLASTIVRDFHGEEAALKAAANFERVFHDRLAPTEMAEVRLARVPGGLTFSRRTSANVVEQVTIPLSSGQIKWSKFLADVGEVNSTSEAERVIKQGGFAIDGRQVNDPTNKVNVDVAGSYEIRFGKKKFVRIVIQV
jgi:tyrosyl-tRNA synthetase